MATRPLTTNELDQLTAGLNRLAHNLWWTWDQAAQDVFAQLSPRGWRNLFHNAVAILREVSPYELRVRLQDPGFSAQVREVLRRFDAYLNDTNTWARQHAPHFQDGRGIFLGEFDSTKPCPLRLAAWACWRATT